MSEKERRKKRKPYHLLSNKGKRYRWSLENKDDSNKLKQIDEEISTADTRSDLFLESLPSTSTAVQLEYLAATSEISSNEKDQDTENAATLSDSNLTHEYYSNDSSFAQDLFSEISSDESGNSMSGHESDESGRASRIVGQPVSEKVENVKEVELFLKNWAVKENVTLTALSSLCAGLKKHHPSCFTFLHSDARTILKTPMALSVVDVPPGQYIHIGLQKQLLSIVSHLNSSKLYPNELSLLFNIDGLPLFHSSPGELYPILFSIPSIPEIKNKVYPVGLYYGEKKPEELSSYLLQFLDELKSLLENGLGFQERQITITVLGFCCDVPAKSFLLGITSHTGYKSCTRCTVHGLTVEKRRVFHDTGCRLRSHDNFINRTDKTFQPRTTPLVNVPGLHFCNSFVLDYMHLICLGVMRTLMGIWCSGPLPLRLSRAQRAIMSENLLSFRSDIPLEFVRKPRETTHMKSWKATEWRMFLLYFGPIILKDLLSTDKYNHFISLHIATTILLSPKKCSEITLVCYAKELLIHFVSGMRDLYGDMYISHNFHSLIHIADDVNLFSDKIPNFTLHSISAFPFENFLQTIKRKVRGHAKPLQQIGKRLCEEFETYIEKPLLTNEKKHTSSVKHHDGPVPALCSNPQYKKVKFSLPEFEISTVHPNNCCRLRNGAIVVVENIVYSTELKEQVVVGKKFLQLENLFGEPFCASEELGTCKVSHLSGRKFWPLRSIEAKCMILKNNDKKVVFSLLHCDTTN